MVSRFCYYCIIKSGSCNVSKKEVIWLARPNAALTLSPGEGGKRAASDPRHTSSSDVCSEAAQRWGNEEQGTGHVARGTTYGASICTPILSSSTFSLSLRGSFKQKLQLSQDRDEDAASFKGPWERSRAPHRSAGQHLSRNQQPGAGRTTEHDRRKYKPKVLFFNYAYKSSSNVPEQFYLYVTIPQC